MGQPQKVSATFICDSITQTDESKPMFQYSFKAAKPVTVHAEASLVDGVESVWLGLANGQLTMMSNRADLFTVGKVYSVDVF